MFKIFKKDKKENIFFILNNNAFITEKERKERNIKTILFYGDKNSNFDNIYKKNFINNIEISGNRFKAVHKIIHFSKNQDMYKYASTDLFQYYQYPYNIDFRKDEIQFSSLQRIAVLNQENLREVAINIYLDAIKQYLLSSKKYSLVDIWIILGALKDSINLYEGSRIIGYVYSYDVFYNNFIKFVNTLKDENIKKLLSEFANNSLKRMAKLENIEASNKSDNAISRCICGSTSTLFVQPCEFKEKANKNQDIIKLSQDFFMGYMYWYLNQTCIHDHQNFFVFLDDFQDYAFDLNNFGKRQKLDLVVVGIKLKHGENIEYYKEKYNIKPDLEYKI